MFQTMGFWSGVKDWWKKARGWKVGDWMHKNKKWLIAAGVIAAGVAGSVVFPGVGAMAVGAAGKILAGVGKTLGKSASAVGALVKSGALTFYQQPGGGVGFRYAGQSGDMSYGIGTGAGTVIGNGIGAKKGCFIATHTYQGAPAQFYRVRACMPNWMVDSYYKHAPKLCKLPRITFLPMMEAIKPLF